MKATMTPPAPARAEKTPPRGKAESAIIESLNLRLAEVIDLHLQARHAHWNVKGPSFIALHELFEQVATKLGEHADLLAERAVQLGGLAEGTLQAAAEGTSLARYPRSITSGMDHVAALVRGLVAFGAKLVPAIGEADEAGDPATADILTEVARDVDKLRWLVEAHAQAED